MDETKGTTPQRKSKGEKKKCEKQKNQKKKNKEKKYIYSLQEVMEKRLEELWKLWNEYLNCIRSNKK